LGDNVFVATENDSVYALNALDGSIVWRTNLGTPVSGSSLPCGNINPSGITSTPVIDAGIQVIYVVAFLNPVHHVLFALNLGNGSLRFQVAADAPKSDPSVQQQRAALTLANGMVYIPYGGLFGDCGTYHGYVVSIKADGTGALVSYQVPTGSGGAIWAPSGVVVDSSGFLYVATGNGFSQTTYDHGDSVIKLSPALQEVSYWAPSNWPQLNRADLDIGSVGPALVGPNTLFQAGKAGVGYPLATNALWG
jgi:outer membrane protein assembly factor BamB